MYCFLRSLLAGSAAAVILATSAQAESPTTLVGTLSGDYSNSRYSGGGGNADTWGLNAAGAFGLGMNDIAAEVDGSWHSFSSNGVDANIWGIGGNVFWAPGNGRFGPSVSYTSINFSGAASGLDAHATTYGLFGEFFVSDAFTIGVKGGGTDGKASLNGVGSSSGSGGYVGGELTGYAMPDLAIKGTIDYLDVSGSHVTSYGVGAEYLVSETTPFSIFGGYTRGDLSGGAGHVDNWFIGVKYYTGGGGSLVTQNRSKTLGSIGTVPGVRFAF